MTKKTTLKYSFTTDAGTVREQMLAFRRESGEGDHSAFLDSFYFGNPIGDAYLMLCDDGGKIVGTENYVQQQVSLGGLQLRAAMGVDTLVHPKYRLFHGVFAELCKRSVDALDDHVDFLFSRPNEASLGYYTKYFGWTKPTTLRFYKKVIVDRSSPLRFLLSLLHRGRRQKHLELCQVDTFSRRGLEEVLAGRARNADYAYFPKSTEFLDWKFLRNTFYACDGFVIEDRGTTVGYVVTRDDDGVRHILDFYAANDSPDLFKRLISLLTFEARKDGVRVLTVCCATEAWYEPLLKKQFFFDRDEIEFLVKSLRDDEIPKRWIVQTGDFDIFE